MLLKKFPAFNGTREFVTAFTRACQRSRSWPRPMQSIFPSHFLEIHFNIILPSTPGSFKWSLFFGSSNQSCLPLSCPHTCHMIRLSHSSCFDHSNNIWWGVQIIKLFFMYILLHFSVTSSFLEPTIFLSTILSNTLSLCSCLCAWKNDSAPMILRVLWLQFVVDYKLIFYKMGARGSAVGWGTALKAGRSRVRYPIVSLKFFIDIILPTALWSWGSLSL